MEEKKIAINDSNGSVEPSYYSITWRVWVIDKYRTVHVGLFFFQSITVERSCPEVNYETLIWAGLRCIETSVNNSGNKIAQLGAKWS
jgi:hypothetical protein